MRDFRKGMTPAPQRLSGWPVYGIKSRLPFQLITEVNGINYLVTFQKGVFKIRDIRRWTLI